MDQLDDDMQYVTRRELREELDPIHAVLRTIVASIDALRETFVTRVEFRAFRAEMTAEFRAVRAETASQFEAVRIDLAGQIRGSTEAMRSEFRAFYDKFSDVHPRLDALEAGPSPPTRRPARRAVKKRTKRRMR